MPNVKFTVDAALLRELGARLVGQPHIALAELIKNAYDADARHIRIAFDGDSIVLEDDGHGMSMDDFVDFWMRVGTTHKREDKTSPNLGRPYTGSKGVGRLAAQLLANNLELTSTGLIDKATKGYQARAAAGPDAVHRAITATVDWERAARSAELTEVIVPVRQTSSEQTYANGSTVGTRIKLTKLQSIWDKTRFRRLAQEVWALQPPFEVSSDDNAAFSIELESPYGEVMAEFVTQMNAIFENWHGRISYELTEDDPKADVLFDFDPLVDYDKPDDQSDENDADAPDSDSTEDETATEPGPVYPTRLLRLDLETRRGGQLTQLIRVVNCPVDKVKAHIRVFNLTRRQANHLSVDDSRSYMSRFGGVHIYDDLFRLPYYGPEDWLDLERDHARRLSRSQLVPSHLRVAKGLHDLPSRRRIFGTAHVSTAAEAATAAHRDVPDHEALAIQVTRDRLTDNESFVALKQLVRLGLDLYSTEVSRSRSASKAPPRQNAAPPRRPSNDLDDLRAVVSAAKTSLTSAQYESITDYLDGAEKNAKATEDTLDNQSGLFGSLATVGMTVLAWEHEATKQRLVVRDAAETLRASIDAEPDDLREVVLEQSDSLDQSVERMSDVAGLFGPVLDRESRETRASFRARVFISSLAKQLRVLARGATVDTTAIPKSLVLPPATHAAWAAIMQNLLVNAFNAVLETKDPLVKVSGGADESGGWLTVQDTGVGVDLATSEQLFAPFVRAMFDDPRRAELGLGGSGLGLTIVRMITDSIAVTVKFEKPDPGFATAVRLSWEI